jgi:hypothetical protein
VQGNWKQRWVELSADCFLMYKQEGDAKWTQKVYLNNATAKMHVVESMENTFVVNAYTYDADSQGPTKTRRDFYLHAESAPAAEHWVYMLRYVIERLQLKDPAKDNRAIEVTKPHAVTQTVSHRSALIDPASRCLVVVSIDAARYRVDSELHSWPPHPYCLAELDGKERRTCVLPESFDPPEWNEDFLFDMKHTDGQGQVLRITLFDRDFVLSDTTIGNLTIDLGTLTAEPWEEESMDRAVAPTWYLMRPLKSQKVTPLAAELLVSVRLFIRSADDVPAALALEPEASHDSTRHHEDPVIEQITNLMADIEEQPGISVKKDWLCEQLVELQEIVIAHRDTPLPVVDGKDLDDTSKRWLATEYSEQAEALGQSAEAAAPESADYYYLDAQHEPHGPFTLILMVAWVQAGYMHGGVLVKRGIDGEYGPLTTFPEICEGADGGDEWPKLIIRDESDRSADFNNWEFDIWKQSKHELVLLAGSLFLQMGFRDTFKISTDQFKAFVLDVHDDMSQHSNTKYHTFIHAVDVAQVG